jgi:hypothetical protein
MALAQKTKRSGRTAKLNIRLSFLNEKNLRAKPSISAAKAQRLVSEIEAISGGGAAAESCTTESCGQVVKGVKLLAAKFDVTLTCRYTCKWFYSTGGGWQKECYFKCNDKDRGITLEGTGSL